MVNRRVLRIKVMQALYAFFQHQDERIDVAEQKLIKNIFAIYDLYIYQLSFLIEIIDYALESIEKSKNKHFPTEAEKHPNTRFIDNRIIYLIENNPDYISKRNHLKINWADQKDLIRRTFLKIKEDESYLAYMDSPENTINTDEAMLEHIIDVYLAENEELQQYYEDLNVYWADDFDISCFMLIKTVKFLKNSPGEFVFLPKLFHNLKDDSTEEITFIRDLFCKTIIHYDYYDDLIESKLDNWEDDRIAPLDSLILKMALCEFLEFPTIPTKVTINEYIEISKLYSTPKSKIFINGIIDKLLFDLTEKKKIQKKGRGLIG